MKDFQRLDIRILRLQDSEILIDNLKKHLLFKFVLKTSGAGCFSLLGYISSNPVTPGLFLKIN